MSITRSARSRKGEDHLALAPDAVHDRAVASQGMGSSRLGIAPFEPLVITIEKQHPQLAPVAADGVGEASSIVAAAKPRVRMSTPTAIDGRSAAVLSTSAGISDAGRLSKLS